MLNINKFKVYIDGFNEVDPEPIIQGISNAETWEWMKQAIPFFECSARELEQTYYFRWWVFRKHLRKTNDGWVVTEFLPQVPWAGKHNAISCPAGHHFYEGRWLRTPHYLNDYAIYWFENGGSPRAYSFWAADSIWAHAMVHDSRALLERLYSRLKENYSEWEKSHQDKHGLFWQHDDRDGMEFSIGGPYTYRPTINSYMYGDARAIANIGQLLGYGEDAQTYHKKAEDLGAIVCEKLWDSNSNFFKSRTRSAAMPFVDVRELIGYVPWYFNLPRLEHTIAWQHLMDDDGFHASYGPTTAERRHPRFMEAHDHDCLWNGPSWPFATTQTLVALANLLNGEEQKVVLKSDYWELLCTYARSHKLIRTDGVEIPWIDENLDPFDGRWLAKERLELFNDPIKIPGRGKDYNHSGYCDLIITGLVGLRPRADNVIEINPLAPEGALEYFYLNRLNYKGLELDIFYDQTGERYNQGVGLHIKVNGVHKMSSGTLSRLTLVLSSEEMKGHCDSLEAYRGED